MNQKIEIFSFAALPSSNTKKNHPKWDLGKDFPFQAFIERLIIKIRIFPKTSRKRFWPRDRLEATWRQCWSFRPEKRSAQASAHPLSQAQGSLFGDRDVRPFVCFVTDRVLTKTEWNAQGVNVCFSKSLYTFVWFLFFVTWKLLWTRNNQC